MNINALFLSVPLLVEMGQENVELNAVDQMSAVTLTANHRLHHGATPAHAQCGKLDSGIR